MSLRGRIALLAAGSVAGAVLVVSAAAFWSTRTQLYAQVDESLRERAPVVTRDLARRRFPGLPLGGLDFIVQFVQDGDAASPPGEAIELPVTEEDLAVARGERRPVYRTVDVDGVRLRMLTARVGRRGGPSATVQIARPLTEVDAALRGLAVFLGFALLGGAGLAGGLGLLVARSALRPVGELTDAAEHVARTQELDARIPTDRTDELGRLAGAFDTMLEALDASRRQQRQLVSDASHELRTPLTSLRTNVELLERARELPPTERDRVLADLRSELEELSGLVAELVDLATGAADTEPVSDVRLDEVAASVVDRARRRTGAEIALDAEPVVVRGRATMLERAISNLVDNACKWGPERVEVRLDGGRVEVRDRGPGFAPEDRPHVFERFYRADAARSTPGSGLGLAIVKQAVEAHGGTVFVDDAPGGGAVVGFTLPGAEPAEA